jgi:NhaP-type Na+/H+ and K+/H+ antiporter
MHAFNLVLLAAGLLVFTSLLAGVVSTRLGLPFLLVFLIAGMLVGVDGLMGVSFDNAQLSAWVGNAALAVILLEGGISTRMQTFRAGFKPALLLATVGVLLTAGMVAVVAVWVMKVDWRYGLLLAVVLASLLLQGRTLARVAQWLKVVEPPEQPPPEHRAVQGRLTLGAELPLPQASGLTLRDWLTDKLARDAVEGDGIDWHGAHFRVISVHEGRISRVGLALAP